LDLIFVVEDIKVWRASLDVASLAPFESTLSPDELERAGTYSGSDLRRRFVARRGILRFVLGSTLNCDPKSLQFELGAYGKPSVIGLPLHFNASSSRDEALVAVCKSRPVGVDIEWIDSNFSFGPLLVEHFTDRERTATGDIEAFSRAWTRKEACAKALGLGLSQPLNRYDVSTPNPALPVHEITVPPGFVGAVAVDDRHRSHK
jgi:4'-phosphopantetheinyl transferase